MATTEIDIWRTLFEMLFLTAIGYISGRSDDVVALVSSAIFGDSDQSGIIEEIIDIYDPEEE